MTTASAAHSPRGAVGGGAGVGRADDAAGGLGAVGGGGAGAAGAASLSREAAAGTISAADGFAADREAVRSGLRWHAKGVAVITAGVHQPVGFAATSLATVSFEPPVLSFAVRKRSASWPVLAAEDRVMVHLLADDQADLARLFGVSGGAKFAEGIRWSRGAEGLPVLDGALAWIMLTVVRRLHFDGHAIVLGRITAVRASAGRRPLIHHDGAYGALA
ncbi:flavin reductase (DIM6/NTAB) family NADH-FMN oxidoreductase RutF [Catenulispora sp. MAP5-51]|uniref:flavin reductase family protein n=1 Tax=Catenulispora sp. MAP5-51 TaxID=3156298 RepID=UPI0035134E56